MTHLAMALRFLASDQARAPVVFVVPEGYDNPSKPLKSDYPYRYELIRMQLEGVFDSLIVPLDIGEGADTIEIVRRFIRMFPGAKLELTHLLGSDSLPFAAKLLPEDMAAWKEQSRDSNVEFSYLPFVVQREGAQDPKPYVEQVRSAGVDITMDDTALPTPSSTDFRQHGNFSIVFPTDGIVHHLEVLFRYNLNKPWSFCYYLGGSNSRA